MPVLHSCCPALLLLSPSAYSLSLSHMGLAGHLFGTEQEFLGSSLILAMRGALGLVVLVRPYIGNEEKHRLGEVYIGKHSNICDRGDSQSGYLLAWQSGWFSEGLKHTTSLKAEQS